MKSSRIDFTASLPNSLVGKLFLERYETVRLLGEGGMGRVYLARQLDMRREVVVKVMHERVATNPKLRARFQRETLLMANFQHPYAAVLYDASLNDPKGPCIVMEYIRGITLDILRKSNGRLHPARVGRLLDQLCEVLHAAHTEGIIHRDIKPANIMVTDADTPFEKIKVLDFGLAKLVDDSYSPKISVTDQDFALGTPSYVSPEQARGREVDHRSDLYSVGVILYELLTGRLPFTGDSPLDVMLAHVSLPPPPFAAVSNESWLTPALEAVVQTCLAKDPKQRPAGARDLAELYRKALTGQGVLKVVTEALPAAKAASLQPAPSINRPLTSPIGQPNTVAAGIAENVVRLSRMHSAEMSTTAAVHSGSMSGPQCSHVLDNPSKKERRSWDRVPVQVKVFCQKVPGEDELCWSARVMDISRGGMRLLSPHKFDPMTTIRISKADGMDKRSELKEALVVRAHNAPGENWTMGCALTQELSGAELLAWIDGN